MEPSFFLRPEHATPEALQAERKLPTIPPAQRNVSFQTSSKFTKAASQVRYIQQATVCRGARRVCTHCGTDCAV